MLLSLPFSSFPGRLELPDNLKVLFRPLAMIRPEMEKIIEFTLFSFGFLKCKAMARKIIRCYTLCRDHLRHRDYYCFGLRSLKSVLVIN